MNYYAENRRQAEQLLSAGKWGDGERLSSGQRRFLKRLCSKPCEVTYDYGKPAAYNFDRPLDCYQLQFAPDKNRNLAKWLRSLPELVGQRSDGRYTLVLTKGQLASLSRTIPKVLEC